MPTFAPGEAEPQIYNMTCSWPLNHEWQVALEPQFSAPEASFPPHSVLSQHLHSPADLVTLHARSLMKPRC